MTANPWSIQRSQRPGKGWYCQATYKEKGKVVSTIGLGYLDDEKQGWARSNIALWGGRLSSPNLTDAERKTMILADPEAATAALKAADSVSTRKLIDAGELSQLPLSDFVDQIWRPVRLAENNPRTWARERRFAWVHILAAIGHVRMDKLDAARWAAFLASRTEWSGRTKAIIQTAYRVCLRYACEIGVIPAVHNFRPIKGASKPTLPTPDNLTDEEVDKVLDAARTPVHRALYAYTFGQGCRPSEATSLRWEQIDFASGLVTIAGTKTTQSHRVVPLMRLSGVELHHYWSTSGQPSEGLVFTFSGAEIRDWKHGFASAVKRSGINMDGRRIVRYSARYTYAAKGLLEGRSDRVMAETMGHTSESRVLQRTYQRLRPEQVRQALGDAVWTPGA